jgi:predicted amidohydrolase
MAAARQPFKVAAIEFNPEFMEFSRNVEAAARIAEEAAKNGARLIVMPEAAVSGYIYRDLEQFLPFMDTVPGKTTDALHAVTQAYNCYIAIGIAEIDQDTGLTYNTGVLMGPSGLVGKYRKNGLNPSDVLWFVPGNTGQPVFDTELGRITMIICYDDTYWEPARLAAVKGCDIIAYICSSDRVLPQLGAEAAGKHSTIAAVQHQCAWNGLAMVAADRNNAETNPTTGITVTYGGAASIWQADGQRIAHAPATDSSKTMTNGPSIIYGEIDPALFDNEQKRLISRRRPELYRELAFYRAPTDTAASKASHEVSAAALQYRVNTGDFAGNLNRCGTLINAMASEGSRHDLVVLPAFSFSGPVTKDNRDTIAEHIYGKTAQAASEFAVLLRSHLVASFIEHDGGNYFHTAILVAPDGKTIGRYRQTHLPAECDGWLSAGSELPVFETSIGRIGLLLNEDFRFPEASGVLSIRRADIIAAPVSWSGQYGGRLRDAEGLFDHPYAANTMILWYAAAKTAQAYTVVANAIDNGALGSSGIFTINPIDSLEGPAVGSVDNPEVVKLTFTTLGGGYWMNQAKLIAGRRADLAAPLTFPAGSKARAQWQAEPGFDIGAWSAYHQSRG